MSLGSTGLPRVIFPSSMLITLGTLNGGNFKGGIGAKELYKGFYRLSLNVMRDRKDFVPSNQRPTRPNLPRGVLAASCMLSQVSTAPSAMQA